MEPGRCNELLIKTLTVILELYGNRNATNEIILEYAITSIKENFSHFAIDEIPEAFNLWSKNVINGSEPYGGEFNLLVINRILSDYDKYRKKDRKELFNKIHTEKTEMEKQEQIKTGAQKYSENIKEIIQEIIRKAQRYDDIHNWIFPRCEKEGFLSLTLEEKIEIKARAIEEEKQELRQEMYFCKDKTRVKEIKTILESENGTERAKVIAGQMAVWENREKLLKI